MVAAVGLVNACVNIELLHEARMHYAKVTAAVSMCLNLTATYRRAVYEADTLRVGRTPQRRMRLAYRRISTVLRTLHWRVCRVYCQLERATECFPRQEII